MLDTLGTQSMIVIYLKECINEIVIFRDKNDTQFAYVCISESSRRAGTGTTGVHIEACHRQRAGWKERRESQQSGASPRFRLAWFPSSV